MAASASWGWPWPRKAAPKVSQSIRPTYSAVMKAVTMPVTNTIWATLWLVAASPAPAKPAFQASVRISSLDQNPASGAIPVRARAPTRKVTKVTGIARASPPISLMLLEWTAWMIAPAARNSRALKKAWVNRWKIPAEYPPTLRAAIM